MRTAAALAPLTLALLALAPTKARAVEPLDVFSARIGGYITSWDTNVRADGRTARGTDVDIHKDFGLDDSGTIAYVGLTWRPWESHEFGLTYYTDDAKATRTITRNIEFQDTLYPVNSTVNAHAGIDAYEAYYVWWAGQRDNWALGPRVGLIWYRLDLSLQMVVDANGNQVGAGFREEASADLPSITLGGAWRWTPGGHGPWRIGADVGYFKANINDVDANVTFGRIGVEYFPWEQAGFSLDYTRSKISADASKSHFVGNVDFIDAGLKLGFVYRW
ncbi:hypothetical protein LVB87_02665 [Lysobacter sp. KIS68-7]|uniref:hypothetical protein n=1 Tax=Lysobacter sp. KIS68-7 TaxID=2904252 RepID=UPI001E31668D|nr:hypothetical protein [Lysobacter sp. KIS68-7]UHQ20080.1 hypothetical protein LVB87_02665 [Lysobacter sp. KIS68-7]